MSGWVGRREQEKFPSLNTCGTRYYVREGKGKRERSANRCGFFSGEKKEGKAKRKVFLLSITYSINESRMRGGDGADGLKGTSDARDLLNVGKGKGGGGNRVEVAPA